jgi:hypothetical protein
VTAWTPCDRKSDSRLLDRGDTVDAPRISNVRHVAVLTDARQALVGARELAADAAPEEIVLRELHAARSRFDELMGRGPVMTC